MSLSLSCLTAFVLHQIWKGSRAPARSQPALLTHLTWGSWKWLYVKFLTSWLKVFGIYLETHTSFSTQPCPFQTFFFPWKAFYSVFGRWWELPLHERPSVFSLCQQYPTCERWLEMKPLRQSLWGRGPASCVGQACQAIVVPAQVWEPLPYIISTAKTRWSALSSFHSWYVKESFQNVENSILFLQRSAGVDSKICGFFKLIFSLHFCSISHSSWDTQSI